jgi:hypothetical protein
MTEHGSKESLISIWEQHRNRILTYGHVLHGLLPGGDPPVTLHGRDTRPGDEGVGAHFQYTLADDMYNGTVVSACFAVQVELVGSHPTRVKVDAVPLLEYRGGHYEIIGRRFTSIALDDFRALWMLFAYSLRGSATDFFNLVRAGDPVGDKLSGFTSPSQDNR